jgi:hypothetical protein
MYQPKFCAECSARIIRLRWHLWSSRRFCDNCSTRFLPAQAKRVASSVLALFLIGMAAGQAAHRASPPVVIQRTQSSPLSRAPDKTNGETLVAGKSSSAANSSDVPIAASEEIYACGARTKKGTPCTRRVHGAVRCWQHLGLPAMLSQERLRITVK